MSRELSKSDYVARCAKVGIPAQTVRRILGMKIKEFEEYDQIYAENFTATTLTLSEIAIQEAHKGNKGMLTFYLKTKGNWSEGSRTNLDRDFCDKAFFEKMQILDKLLSEGDISVNDYSKIAKIQLERLGAEEAIEKFKELQGLTAELAERNREMSLKLEKIERGDE